MPNGTTDSGGRHRGIHSQFREAPENQQTLVDEQFLRTLIADFETAAGVVTAIPGTECATLLADAAAAESGSELATSEGECRAMRMTLEVGLEAFFAQNGRWPLDENALVKSGIVRQPFPDFEIVGEGEIVVVRARSASNAAPNRPLGRRRCGRTSRRGDTRCHVRTLGRARGPPQWDG